MSVPAARGRPPDPGDPNKDVAPLAGGAGVNERGLHQDDIRLLPAARTSICILRATRAPVGSVG